MYQIKKRLEIIKLAIFMADDETIRLQLLKLEYFHENEQLDKIINLLKHKNYGQAQILISQYINNLDDNTNKQTSGNIDLKQFDNKNSIIEEFGLLKSNNLSSKHAIVSSHQNEQRNKTKDGITSYTTNYKYFRLTSDEIEKIPVKKESTQQKYSKKEVELSDILQSTKNSSKLENSNQKTKDTKNKEEDKVNNKMTEGISNNNDIQEETKNNQAKNEITQNNNEKENKEINLKMSIDIKPNRDNSSYKQDSQNIENNNKYNTKYPPISDIFHKFQNIALFYIVEKNYTLYKSAANWMQHISIFGYKDADILKISKYIQNLKENKQYDEAIQLALICGATESYLGKLIFARELFRGDIFPKNELKAYEITKELALMDYPEALCDLGQYCEHGIGTKKSLEYALYFYKKASDLGLDRANILYKKLKNKKGLFSFLFKSEF